MAKTNSSQPRLGLVGGQRDLDVSVIGPGMRIVGSLRGSSIVTVAGTIFGSVSADDEIVVLGGGRVAGDVEAREVVLGGEVLGSVNADKRLEIKASAVIRGDICAPRLSVKDGAVVVSVVSMAQPQSIKEPQRGAA